MMLTLKLVLKLLNILNKDASPRAIAGGMALGSIIGITPALSLHNLLVLILIFMVRVNVTSAFFSWGVFAIFSWFFDPLFNKIGYLLLVYATSLKPLWTALYNTPVVPWTKFNNTLTLGSLVFALAFFWPLYFFLVWGVKQYREKFMARVARLKIVQVLKASKLYSLYQSYS
jgi:uncharacterized protein (TIGR03546 family)